MSIVKLHKIPGQFFAILCSKLKLGSLWHKASRPEFSRRQMGAGGLGVYPLIPHRVHRGFALILTHNPMLFPQGGQHTSSRVKRRTEEVSDLSAGGTGVVREELNEGLVLCLLLKLSLSRLRGLGGVALGDQFNFMVNESDLFSVGEVCTNSGIHFSFSHGINPFWLFGEPPLFIFCRCLFQPCEYIIAKIF